MGNRAERTRSKVAAGGPSEVGNAGHCAVTLYVGKGLRGSNGTCSTLSWISVTPSTTHNQIGPLWC